MKDTNLPTGTLETYSAYLKRVVPFTVQIYRPSTTSDEYQLVAEETIIPTTAGPIKVHTSSSSIAEIKLKGTEGKCVRDTFISEKEGRTFCFLCSLYQAMFESASHLTYS
jgi:hypothetical protein